MPDLSTFDTTKAAGDGVEMLVYNPATGEVFIDEESNKPVSIMLMGQDAAEYRNLVYEMNNKRLQQGAQQGRVLPTITTQMLDNDAVDLLVACTKDWKGLKWGGVYLKCTPENARMIYGKLPWLREQAERFIQTRKNYLGNLPTNSSPTPAKSSD